MGPNDNRIVLITGAARGIGLACARRFAAAGAAVVIADLPDETTARRLNDLECAHAYIQADVSKVDDMRHLVDAVHSKLRRH